MLDYPDTYTKITTELVRIELNNNKFRLVGDIMVLDKIYEDMSIRHPQAWYIKPHMPKGWDGKINYVSKAGYVKAGFLKRVVDLLESYDEEYYILDRRDELEVTKIPLKVADFIARTYQIESVESVVLNMVGDVLYPRGVIAAATNAGKTLIAAMIYKSYENAKALILLKNSTLYTQFLDDMPKFFGDNWGYMRGKELRWGDIMVCMTPTLRNRISEYREQLAGYNILLFDECHEAPSKTNKFIIEHLHNTFVRVGLSGTPFDHKDKTKNMDVESFFGPELYRIRNTELIELGFSSPIVVKIIRGNTLVRYYGDYQREYKEGISLSDERNGIVIDRVKFYMDRGAIPLMVVCKFHEHVERLYEMITERFPEVDIRYIHHKVKDRNKILKDFKDGKFPILISSLIIKIGQNIPLMKAMINASSGSSQINTLQLIGRILRTHKSKKKVYYEDFYDEGEYLRIHSKRRIRQYKNQGFKIIELYKP